MQTLTKRIKPTILKVGKGSTYHLNRGVFLFIEGESAQLLDFCHGQFYGLDTIGTLMVSLVLEKGLEEAVEYISQTYDSTEEQVKSDLAQLLQNLEQKKTDYCPRKTKQSFSSMVSRSESESS